MMTRNIHKPKRRIDDIVLLADELLQAIRVEGDLWGDSLDDDEEEAEKKLNKGKEYDHPLISGESKKGNNLRDIVDDDVKREKVIRTIDMAVGELSDLLYPYSKIVERHPCVGHDHKMRHGAVFTNVYKEPELWQLSLEVPVTFSITTTHYLSTLAVEYVVARVIEEYVMIYVEEKINLAAAKVEGVKEKIRAAKDRRVVGVRRGGSVY